MRSRRFIVLLAALAVAACGAPATSSEASADPATVPVQADAARDGVTVTLAVDRGRVTAGGDVTATVWVRNAGVNAVTWQGGGCELQGQFAFTSVKPLPAPPIGHVWDGDKNLIKQLALPDAYTAQWPVPPEFAHRDIAFSCTADLAYNQLEAGEETHATVVWEASTVGGSPLPAGDYVVAVDFPFVARGNGDPLMDDNGVADVKPISARLTIIVEEGPPVPPAIDAMDAILADPAFAAWLKDHPSRTWNSSAIRWIDGAWVVQVRYEPSRMMSARRDPGSGLVTMAESDQR